jgi:hypothetical protein
MDESRSKLVAKEPQRRKGSAPGQTITHCVACNCESKRDFDVCPRCKTAGMAVIVIRKA